MRGAQIARLIGLGIACLLCSAGGATAGEAERAPVLLLTHPKSSELMNFDVLLAQKLLRLEKLKIIGLAHKDEVERYRDAERYIESRDDERMELMRLDCRIAPDKVFAQNGCSETFRQLVASSDGIVFTGGPDIPPVLYGEKTRLTTAIQDPFRHRFELSFLFHLLVFEPERGRPPLLEGRPDYLVLGLCLGMQAMNVATGGSLIQDIPSQIYGLEYLEAYAALPPDARHRSAGAQLDPAPSVGWAHMHRVRFEPDAALSKRLGVAARPPTVLSLHHQAAGRLGAGWRVLARSMDGKVVEAIEHERFAHVLGVQFHPEKRILYDPNLVYRQSAEAGEQNFVFAAMRADPQSRDFLRRFWGLISERVEASRRSRR